MRQIYSSAQDYKVLIHTSVSWVQDNTYTEQNNKYTETVLVPLTSIHFVFNEMLYLIWVFF